MENPVCSKGSNSSAPVAYVGLYIAGCTLVCLLLIFCDLFLSFRRKRLYLPCKFFSLNSATLTLLAIASKLPVDLTTNMPSAADQMSKLAGTSIVCVSMGFMMPSIGINREGENVANMIALSLFIVTIVVNICIQLRTGVIFSFFGEHIVILCCLMMMLAVFWYSTNYINAEKPYLVESNRKAFRKNTSSLIHKVKLWYTASSVFNPQFDLCKDALSSTSSWIISMICLVVLSQAAIRSLVVHKLEFCNEQVSDYRWSVPMILATQIITVVVATLATTCRWFMMITHAEVFHTHYLNKFTKETDTLAFKFLRKKRSPMKKITYLSLRLVKAMESLIYFFIFFTIVCVPYYLYLFVSFLITNWRDSNNEISSITLLLTRKIQRICERDIAKWMNEIYNRSPPDGLVQVLQDLELASLNRLMEIGSRLSQLGTYKLSCLSVLILARAIIVSLPSIHAKPLIQALVEAFELLYYVDQKINAADAKDEIKRGLAKIIFENSKDVNIDPDRRNEMGLMSYRNAMSAIRDEFKFIGCSELVNHETDIVQRYLREYTLADDGISIHTNLEQLFIGILHFFLQQLPGLIVKEVNESPIEEHEERALVAFKLVCKFKFLKDRVTIFHDMEESLS